MNWNAIAYDPTNPTQWRRQLDWNEKAYREAVVLPVDICLPIEFELTFETVGLFDQRRPEMRRLLVRWKNARRN